jgi:hypothetical protein
MEKKSILCLGKTLCDLGYYPEHIKSYMHTIDQILQRGIAYIDDSPGRISAAGIRPMFKINPKSIDVFLNTTAELNVLRIFHPSNPICKGESEAGCFFGNQKWLAGNPWDKGREPNKGFYFTNIKYKSSVHLMSI